MHLRLPRHRARHLLHVAAVALALALPWNTAAFDRMHPLLDTPSGTQL